MSYNLNFTDEFSFDFDDRVRIDFDDDGIFGECLLCLGSCTCHLEGDFETKTASENFKFPLEFSDENDAHSVGVEFQELDDEFQPTAQPIVQPRVERPVPQQQQQQQPQAYVEKETVSVQIEQPRNLGSMSYNRQTVKVPVNLPPHLFGPHGGVSLKRKRSPVWKDKLEMLRKKRKTLNSKEKRTLEGLERGERNISRYEELKSKDDLTAEEMIEKKKVKNRGTAFTSREKKKNEVEKLKRDNTWLLNENARLMALLQRNGISY